MTLPKSQRILAGVLLGALAGCHRAHPYVQTIEAYRIAKKSGDSATAAKYLRDDARIWFEKKEGEGAPLGPEGGPYKDWDREFRSHSTREDLRVVGNTLTYITHESNDFYRLIERQATPARVTYYFDDQGRIAGMLYQGLSSAKDRPPDRFDQFKAWADGRHPGLLDSPEMRIPNQPKRWRELLVQWRRESGLPAVIHE